MSKSTALALFSLSFAIAGLVLLVRLFVNFESPITAEEWRLIAKQFGVIVLVYLASHALYVGSKRLQPKKP